MSKICLVLFFILFFLRDIYGQSDIALGFKLGASLSNVTTKAQGRVDVDTENRIGLQAGLFMNLMDNRSFNIQSELSYEQKFTNFKYPEAEGNYRIDYVAYSLKVRYKFLKDKVRPYVSGGVKVGIFLADKINVTGITVPPTVEDQLSDDCKRTIFSPVIGAGVELKISNLFAFICELSVSPDVSEFFYDSSYEFKAKSFPVSLSAGGKFFIH